MCVRLAPSLKLVFPRQPICEKIGGWRGRERTGGQGGRVGHHPWSRPHLLLPQLLLQPLLLLFAALALQVQHFNVRLLGVQVCVQLLHFLLQLLLPPCLPRALVLTNLNVLLELCWTEYRIKTMLLLASILTESRHWSGLTI